MLAIVIISIIIAVVLIGAMGWAMWNMMIGPKQELWLWEQQDKIKNFFKR